MRQRLFANLSLVFTVLLLVANPGGAAQAADKLVRMDTSLGSIEIQLYSAEAPKTVNNFLTYVQLGFYDGTIFHRVIPEFVIQGGGFDPEMNKKPTNPPVENEADNGLKNLFATLSMARTGDPHSATSQFFINLRDNVNLDHRGKDPRGWGYAVFGKVVKGDDVLRKIAAVPTDNRGPYRDVPVDSVTISRAYLVDAQ